MSRRAVTVLALAALATTPAYAAQGTAGPFPGVVRDGETRTHVFDNDPLGSGCPHVMTTYTVSLAYAPGSDVLTLAVGTAGVTGSAGQASLSLAASWCTRFSVHVTGTDVRAAAGYVVTVTRNGPA